MPTSPLNVVVQHLRAVCEPDGGGMTDCELLARFLENRDEVVLAVLVKRHAPMVWGVCRRLLNHQDAEDAFQATFLVLLRKAADVPRQAVANWLYGVARQTAVHLRGSAAKQRRRETQMVNVPEPIMPAGRDADLRRVVDEELSRLPDHHRCVVVLCDLVGMTRKEAARQLGIPEGSVASRLARARVKLAKRLTHRGVVLSGGAVAAVLSAGSASASPTLVASTIKAASLLAAGQVAGVVSAKVAALTEGVLKAMFMTKIKSVLAVVLVVGLAFGGVGLGGALSTSPVAVAQAETPEEIPAKSVNRESATAAQPEVAAYSPHAVWSVSWSPDGKRLASGAYDGLVRLWDEEGNAKEVLAGHQRAVTFVAWSPEGERLASAGQDGTVRIWAAGGKPGPILEGHSGLVACVAWSPDGKQLASAGFADHTVRLWNADGKPGRVLAGHRSRVHAVAWSPDGKQLASGSYDGTERLWTADGAPGLVLKGGGGKVYAVSWRPDGKQLAVANHDGTVRLWAPDGTPSEVLRGHKGYVAFVAWSPDGKRIVSAGEDQTARLWDVGGKGRHVLKKHGNIVHSAAWSPDGARILSGGMDGLLCLWDSKAATVIRTLDLSGIAKEPR